MLDPKEHVIVVAPKKGACYVCGAALDTLASLQVQVNVPLVKMKKVVGRACLSCSSEFRTFLDLRIAQAKRGEYQV
jgi:hypothetical protein